MIVRLRTISSSNYPPRFAAPSTPENLMRKIIASLFVSLDGVAEAPETWHFPYFNDEMGNAVGAAMANCDAMLLGRVQYQQFAAYWPTSEDEPADFMNNQKKYVVTNTLT